MITGRRRGQRPNLAENYVAGGARAEITISNLENDAGAEDALSEVMIPGGGRRRRRSGSSRSGRGRLRLSGRFILRSRHLQ